MGGTSQIPLVRSRWQFQKNAKAATFDIEVFKDLNIVACGASRYRELVLSPRQLNDKGIIKAQNGLYAEAAAYFNNAKDAEGSYWLGVLYYIGAIGHKRQPAKAYRLFEECHDNFPYLFRSIVLKMLSRKQIYGECMKVNNNNAYKSDFDSINNEQLVKTK